MHQCTCLGDWKEHKTEDKCFDILGSRKTDGRPGKKRLQDWTCTNVLEHLESLITTVACLQLKRMPLMVLKTQSAWTFKPPDKCS